MEAIETLEKCVALNPLNAKCWLYICVSKVQSQDMRGVRVRLHALTHSLSHTRSSARSSARPLARPHARARALARYQSTCQAFDTTFVSLLADNVCDAVRCMT